MYKEQSYGFFVMQLGTGYVINSIHNGYGTIGNGSAFTKCYESGTFFKRTQQLYAFVVFLISHLREFV